MQITPDTQLAEWSEEWIKTILDNDLEEDLIIEFKEGVNSKDPKHASNLRKSITSFANTSGGFVLFGIKDKKSGKGWERLCGVDIQNFSKELTDKISGTSVVPHILVDNPKIINVVKDDKTYNVAVIKIGASRSKPHAVVDESSGLLNFWIRGNSSAIPITYSVLTKMIDESSELRNILATIILDVNYCGYFAQTQMVVPEEKRSNTVSPSKINSLLGGDQAVQIISKIPTDLTLVDLIYNFRNLCQAINTFHDLLISRSNIPLSNAPKQNKLDNDQIAKLVPSLIETAQKIQNHIFENYSETIDWANVTLTKWGAGKK